MRHRKRTIKLNRTSSHRGALFANLLKAMIEQERIVTTVPKAKAIRSAFDQLITLAKKNDLASRRRAAAKLRLHYNALTPKEKRKAKGGDLSSYNVDRRSLPKLFGELRERFSDRNGGYTTFVRMKRRVGDGAELCLLRLLSASEPASSVDAAV